MDIFDYISFYFAALLLVVLKLTHVIDWNWWWIGSPLYVALFLMIVSIIARR